MMFRNTEGHSAVFYDTTDIRSPGQATVPLAFLVLTIHSAEWVFDIEDGVAYFRIEYKLCKCCNV